MFIRDQLLINVGAFNLVQLLHLLQFCFTHLQRTRIRVTRTLNFIWRK